MHPAPQRGSVVVRVRNGAVSDKRPQYGIVWDVLPGKIVVLPVTRAGRHRHAADLALEMAEQLAANIAIADPLVRAGHPIEILGHEQRVVGELPPPALCRLVAKVIRAQAEGATTEIWDADRRHRGYANDRCVNLS